MQPEDPYAHGFVDKQNRVVIHQPDGVILKISDAGAVDLIAHDREACIPQLTTDQAMKLRTETLEGITNLTSKPALNPTETTSEEIGLRHISEPVARVLAAAKCVTEPAQRDGASLRGHPSAPLNETIQRPPNAILARAGA